LCRRTIRRNKHDHGAAKFFWTRCAPAANIHPIPTDTADPEETAHRYESELKIVLRCE